ncbi:MAG: fumarylacetoacetate hydrolase family protein [Agarilytica sp.]
MNTIDYSGTQVIPSKVVCVGRNYADHAKELGNNVPTEPVIFMKPNSAVSDVLSSFHHEPLHYETELSFLIRGGKIAGVGLGLDLTKRQLQTQLKAGALPWERAKAFDGSAVFSAFVELSVAIDSLNFTLTVDGELLQKGSVQQMLFLPHDLVAHINTFSTLNDNDIVMTGTPEGVGELKSGAHYNVTLYAGDVSVLSHCWRAM